MRPVQKLRRPHEESRLLPGSTLDAELKLSPPAASLLKECMVWTLQTSAVDIISLVAGGDGGESYNVTNVSVCYIRQGSWRRVFRAHVRSCQASPHQQPVLKSVRRRSNMLTCCNARERDAEQAMEASAKNNGIPFPYRLLEGTICRECKSAAPRHFSVQLCVLIQTEEEHLSCVCA